MDWMKVKKQMRSLTAKYKYPLLILCLGVLLLLLPTGSNKTAAKSDAVIISKGDRILDAEERLAAVLSTVAGAGEVRVLLTLSKGEETIYQTNMQITGEGGNSRSDTVTVTDSDRNESGLVRQINPAVYQGAVIVCEGAEDPSVRLAIVNAVSNATGLGADRITVLKMK